MGAEETAGGGPTPDQQRDRSAAPQEATLAAEIPEDVELPRGIALAWGVAAHPQRGPKRELSIERIVDAAVEIADAQGLSAVSMAAVAKSLGFTTMSLYRYVTSKDELLLLMSEIAIGVPPLSIGETQGWRESLLRTYHELLAVYAAHPWLLDIPITGIPSTPNNLGWLDAGLVALRDTSLSWQDKVSVNLLVTSQARWTAMIERGYTAHASAIGIEAEELDRISNHIITTLVTPESHPSLHRAVAAGVFIADEDPFDFGFRRILDGVDHYLTTRTAAADAPSTAPSTPETDAFPKDAGVKKARTARREAEAKLREAVKREREAVQRARERSERAAEKQRAAEQKAAAAGD